MALKIEIRCPDPATYLKVMPQLARAFGGNGFAHGAAHLAADRDAAAMWLPPGIQPPLYQRHGFEIVGTIQAGASPTVVPMLRPRR